MRRNIKLLFFLMIILLWDVCGIIRQANAGSPDVLNVATQHARIPTLDPHVQDWAEKYICYMTHEPLVSRDKGTLKLVPKLATSWEATKDAKSFTFSLRKGVKFHDGTEFDANAVKFNCDRITYLKRGYYWVLSGLDKVEVLDRYKVRFILKESFALFPQLLEYIVMVSPKSVLEHEEKKGDYAEKWYIDHGVGTGPYRFVQWEQEKRIVHEKFDEYWGGVGRKTL